MVAPLPKKIFSCDFSQLLSWDFTSNYLNSKNKCEWPTEPLSNLIKLRFEVATESEIANNEVHLLDRISFEDGCIYAGNHADTKMLQYKAFKGDIVVSKINARKGAIGIVTSEVPIGSTIHFRVLIPDNNKVITKFLHLALRSVYCRNQFEILTGGQGKGEISEERLLSINVPFPSIKIQQRIVEHWEMIYDELSSADNALSALVSELHKYLTKKTCGFENISSSRVIITNYSITQQWDVKAGRAAAFINANPNFIPLGTCTEECTETIKPWVEPEKEWPVYGVNNKEGIFLNSMVLGKKFNAPYKRIEKDWFFHNPTRANVGSLGKVPEVLDGAITSPEYQVWKLKRGFLPDFMALLLKTEYFLSLVEFNRVGGVKQRMYYSNLAEIRLPEIDDVVQLDFIDRQQKILTNIKSFNELLPQRKKEIEKMILGKHTIKTN